MADADKRLDILIAFGLNDAEAKKAVSLLDELKVGTEKGGEATKEAAKGVELFNTHGRDMHKLIHGLNELVPGLGSALKFAFHPGTIGIGVTLLLVQQFAEHLKKAKEEAEALAQATANTWIAQRDAAEELLKMMGEVASKQDELKTKWEAEGKILEALIEQRKKLTGADDTAGEAAKLDSMATHRAQLNRATLVTEGQQRQLEYETERAGKNLPSLEGRDEAGMRAKINAANKTLEAYAAGSASFHQASGARDVLEEVGPKLAQFEKDRAQVQQYNDLKERLAKAIAAHDANKAALDGLTQEYETGKRLLQIHRQTESFADAPATMTGGNFQKNAQLAQALGYSEQAQQAFLNAILNHTANRDQYFNAALARIAQLEAQMRSAGNFPH